MEKGFKIDVALMDTGILYALADKKDSWHKRAVDFVSVFGGRLIVPFTVIPEVCYLLNAYMGQAAELAFINSLVKRELSVEHFREGDLSRCSEILRQYGDNNIGLVDASIIAVAERLKIRKVCTTDWRHFSVVRPKHCDALELLP